jgi:hypothetical protein
MLTNWHSLMAVKCQTVQVTLAVKYDKIRVGTTDLVHLHVICILSSIQLDLCSYDIE